MALICNSFSNESISEIVNDVKVWLSVSPTLRLPYQVDVSRSSLFNISVKIIESIVSVPLFVTLKLGFTVLLQNMSGEGS